MLFVIHLLYAPYEGFRILHRAALFDYLKIVLSVGLKELLESGASEKIGARTVVPPTKANSRLECYASSQNQLRDKSRALFYEQIPWHIGLQREQSSTILWVHLFQLKQPRISTLPNFFNLPL